MEANPVAHQSQVPTFRNHIGQLTVAAGGGGRPALYAVVAMGAVFASATRAPLTSLASVVEMTGDFSLTLLRPPSVQWKIFELSRTKGGLASAVTGLCPRGPPGAAAAVVPGGFTGWRRGRGWCRRRFRGGGCRAGPGRGGGRPGGRRAASRRGRRGDGGREAPSPAVPAQELNVVASAARAGVGHVVKATSKASADSPIARRRGQSQIEAGLAASGLAHTLLRSNAYMQNVLALAPAIAATSGFGSAAAKGRAGMVDARDVGAVAAEIAAAPASHAGKTY
jgi:hypothetical protein